MLLSRPTMNSNWAMLQHGMLLFAAIIAVLVDCSSGLAPIMASPHPKSASIVTGSRGYLGRQIIHELIADKVISSEDVQHEIVCLVRQKNVKEEKRYWDKVLSESCFDEKESVTLHVLPYDMLDGGITVSKAIEYAFRNEVEVGDESIGENLQCCLYHVASIFTPCDNHSQMALDNVKGTEDLMNAVIQSPTLKNTRVILTSSTAAVRGPNQDPLNGKWYTYKDWNTASELGKNWGNSYQWSKAQSERKAWDLAKEHNVSMVSLCPSFIFGPPNGETSSSYSIEIVESWITGTSPTQSRLCVDIRDVAKAQILAGRLPNAVGERIIVSSEARISSQQAVEEFKRIAVETGFDPDKIHPDTQFDGGAVSIGKCIVVLDERMSNTLN